MPRVTLDGTELYYEVHGEGPTVTLCHGVGGNHAIWFQQIASLSASHRLITFDHRGFGNSPDPSRCGRRCFVDDLGGLLDHLGVETTALVGQSMGGGTCVGFTAKEPERVTALVLADSLHGLEEPDDVAELMATARAHTDALTQLERVLGATTREGATGTRGALLSNFELQRDRSAHTQRCLRASLSCANIRADHVHRR